MLKQWNVMTLIWRESNFSFFAALLLSCLKFKALHLIQEGSNQLCLIFFPQHKFLPLYFFVD